jgi:hypothetical protein
MSLTTGMGMLHTFPWAYSYDIFPAAWFGGNKTHWETASQLAELGKYSLAVLGWQHLTEAGDWDAVVYLQLSQAAGIKRVNPSLPVFCYASLGWAFAQNAAVLPLMSNPRCVSPSHIHVFQCCARWQAGALYAH